MTTMRSVWSPKATWPAGEGLSRACNASLSATTPAGPRYIGESTWISATGVEPIFRGQAAGHQIDDQPLRGLGIGGGQEEEIAVGRRLDRGHLAPVDAVRGHDDGALRRLTKKLGQVHLGNRLALEDIRQHAARPDRRQLIGVAHQQQMRFGVDRAHQPIGQQDIEHRDLIHDDEALGQRALLVVAEVVGMRLELQQAMERAGGASGRLGHAAGGASGGRGQGVLDTARVEHIQQRAQRRRLADAGAAGQHHRLRLPRQPHRLALPLRQPDAPLAFERGERLLPGGVADRRQRIGRVEQQPQPARGPALGVEERREVDAIRLLVDEDLALTRRASSAGSSASSGTSSRAAARVSASARGR